MGREQKVKVNKVKSKASKVSENVSIFVYLFYLCSGDSKVSTSQSTWVKLKVKVSVYLCLYLFHLTWDTALVECQTVSQAAVYALRAKSRSEQIKSKRKQDLCLYLHLWMYVNVSTCVLLMCLAHVPDPRHSALVKCQPVSQASVYALSAKHLLEQDVPHKYCIISLKLRGKSFQQIWWNFTIFQSLECCKQNGVVQYQGQGEQTWLWR